MKTTAATPIDRVLRSLLLALTWLLPLAVLPCGEAQSEVSSVSAPRSLDREFDAMGSRLPRRLRERLRLTGSLKFGRSAAQPVEIIRQSADLFRVRTRNGSEIDVVVNSRRASRSSSVNRREAVDLLQTLRDDWPDDLFIALQGGRANLRRVARRVPSDDPDDKASDPTMDVFRVFGPLARENGSDTTEAKLYYFSTATGQLRKVAYTDPDSGDEVETRFADWKQIDGNPLPSRIERIRNGATVFTLEIDRAFVRPNVNDGVFTDLAGTL